MHNRDIYIRCDDLRLSLFEKEIYPIRRSRWICAVSCQITVGGSAVAGAIRN